MVVSCCAYNCRVRAGDGYSFHRFPTKAEEAKKWCIALRRKDFKPSKHTRLCSNHFTQDCYIKNERYHVLKKGAIPTVFDFTEEKPKTKSKKLPSPTIISLRRPSDSCYSSDSTLQSLASVPENDTENMEGNEDSMEDCEMHEVPGAVDSSDDLTTENGIHDYLELGYSYSKDDLEKNEMNEIDEEDAKINSSTDTASEMDDQEEKGFKTIADILDSSRSYENGTEECIVIRSSWDGRDTTSFIDNLTQECTENIFDVREIDYKKRGKSDTDNSKVEYVCPLGYVKNLVSATCVEMNRQLDEIGRLKKTVKLLQNTVQQFKSLTHILEKDDLISKEAALILKGEVTYVSEKSTEESSQLPYSFSEEDVTTPQVEFLHVDESKKVVPVKDTPAFHKAATTHRCKLCTATFSDIAAFIDHYIDHTNETPYTCRICDKGFYELSHLTQHRCEKFICEICKETFLSRYDLNLHSVTHAEEAYHGCEICGASFANKAQLKEHWLTHKEGDHGSNDVYDDASFENMTKRQHHTCELCDKSFYWKRNLNRHYRTHSENKNHVCNVCSKTFCQKTNLINHYRVHTNEKPYICEFCGKRFSLKTNLTRHYISHSNQKPHVCNVCGKGYTQKTNLNKHYSIHTKETPLS